MREIIDREILGLFEGLFARLSDLSLAFLHDAQALCAIFMFLYFGIKSYGMLSGDRPLEIMPLLRPFALALVIIFWTGFVDAINFPLQVVTEKAKGLLEDKIDLINTIQQERRELLSEVARRLIEDSAELEQFNTSNDVENMALIGVDFGAIFDEIKGYYIILLSKFRYLIMETIEFVTISFFQACSYLIFFLQVVFAAILIILGPFSFALSVLPGFRNAYTGWIARYISVSLYTGIGYIIMSLSMVIIEYSLRKELLLLEYVLSDERAFFFYITSNDGGSNFYLVALVTGGLAMLTIPVISTWIINTAGVGSAISSMKRGTLSAAGMLK